MPKAASAVISMHRHIGRRHANRELDLLGNVTTVTKSGLTLTVGQTYYFSVQAVMESG